MKRTLCPAYARRILSVTLVAPAIAVHPFAVQSCQRKVGRAGVTFHVAGVARSVPPTFGFPETDGRLTTANVDVPLTVAVNKAKPYPGRCSVIGCDIGSDVVGGPCDADVFASICRSEMPVGAVPFRLTCTSAGKPFPPRGSAESTRRSTTRIEILPSGRRAARV